MKSPVESYFSALAEIRTTGGGVKETSFYPPLINLLNAIGETLKPRVLAVSQLKNWEPTARILGCSLPSKSSRARQNLYRANCRNAVRWK